MLKFLSTKGKAITVFVFSLCFLGFFILSSLVATQICQKWYGLAVGIALMLLAIPFHRLGKKKPWGYVVSFALNAIGAGFVVSAYYLKIEAVLALFPLLIAAIPAAAILLLVYLMLQSFSKTKTVTLTIAAILNGLLTIATMVLWIIYGDVTYSFAFFCSLISLFYLCVFGITVNHDDRSVFRDISFGSFGSLIIIAVVVIFVISEGEALDGLDFGGSDGSKKSKKR